ncbi:isochorismatase family cysteine hydrolase [Streptomyces flavofungini]|uniref:isochorismatase family cysteine hydrolase n=1 Tax=Streptomyces flavofungini TaxID=68200 RepID=UPI0025AFED2C|nr:isochorismatase family cysteine hydrolase [Streptomyces flavofungini]WJV51768.1 isochorismatase family cysteine hydrolase [Streptomyces flavofungini]
MALRKADWVDPRRTALIVIDVQNGFVNKHSRSVVPAIAHLVKRWQETDAPVVFARFHNEPGSPYERITGWTNLRTAEEQALVAELEPYAGAAAAVIDKGQSSVFTTEGARMIRDAGWSDLVLCGIDTDSCVYDSAVAAYQAGYRPWIVTDACASTGGTQYHDAALLLAARNISAAQLVTSKDVLEQLGHQGACA